MVSVKISLVSMVVFVHVSIRVKSLCVCVCVTMNLSLVDSVLSWSKSALRSRAGQLAHTPRNASLRAHTEPVCEHTELPVLRCAVCPFAWYLSPPGVQTC
jgi:hypothetical protein